MKKSQSQQVFIYLLTILIMGLMFYFGIKWMGKLMSAQDEINTIQLKVDMENSFEKIRSNYGSWKYEEFKVPNEVEVVCFVDQSKHTSKTGSGLCSVGHADFNRMMCDMWDGEANENIFFGPSDSLATPIYVKNIRVSDSSNYQCYKPDRGRIRVKLTGLGDAVKVG